MSHWPHRLRDCLAMMQTKARVLVCLAFILFVSQAAAAQSNNIYEIRGTTDFGIYHINAIHSLVRCHYRRP